MTSRHLPILGLAALLSAPLHAGPGTADAVRDWPQIRGPQRDGRSPETGIADAWPAGGPPRVWRRPIGAGFSGVSVAGGGLFTMAAYDGTEHVLRLDPATGEEVWRTAVGEVFPMEFGDGPRSTPTVEGDRLYVLSTRGRLAGEWELTIETPPSEEGQPWQTTPTTSTITPVLDGALLEERFTVDRLFGPVTVVRQRSWDRFREVYRFTHADDSTAQLKVFEGLLEEGRLTVSNASTGTASRVGDTEILERQVTYDIGPDGFRDDWQRSTDGGETWLVTARYAYARSSRP